MRAIGQTGGTGLSLRQAALVAGFGLLILTIAAPFAEFAVYARLVDPADGAATVQNIRDQSGLYLAGIFAYLLVFIFDIVVAWALYLLLRPVNPALSLLSAWFRLVYTALALFASLKLVTAYRLVHGAPDGTVAGPDALQAQVALQMNAFRVEWGFSLILFAIHLLLLGWLVFRAAYIPKALGVLLAIAGLGWVVYELSPFLMPAANVGWLFVTFLGETVFMLWLLIRGWSIAEPES